MTSRLANRSPAVQRVMDGAAFDFDGDNYWVDGHYPDGDNAARDVVVLRGVEYMGCVQRKVRRAVQMRDIEAWIEQDWIDFAFVAPTPDVNVSSDWTSVVREVEGLEDLLLSDHLGRRDVRPAWS